MFLSVKLVGYILSMLLVMCIEIHTSIHKQVNQKTGNTHPKMIEQSSGQCVSEVGRAQQGFNYHYSVVLWIHHQMPATNTCTHVHVHTWTLVHGHIYTCTMRGLTFLMYWMPVHCSVRSQCTFHMLFLWRHISVVTNGSVYILANNKFTVHKSWAKQEY